MMTYDELLKALAPCGLNCGKCLAYDDGDIKKHALELKRLLGTFEGYAKRFAGFKPVFEKYPEFREVLDCFTEGGCGGCRTGGCRYPNCGVTVCYKEKNIDFCFQCAEFPCSKTNFDDNLKSRWLAINNRMKVIGAEAYYRETRDLPRYV